MATTVDSELDSFKPYGIDDSKVAPWHPGLDIIDL